MNNINNYVPGSGREMRDDNSIINTANYLAPRPNGDQVIVVAAAGVKTLTVPEDTIAAEIAYAPVDLHVRYGANIPDANTGAYYPEGTAILLDSYEKATTVNIYVSAPCNFFIQYYK